MTTVRKIPGICISLTRWVCCW